MKRYLSILLTIVMLFTSLPLNVFADATTVESGVIAGDTILVDEDDGIIEQKTDEGIQEDSVDNPTVDIDTSQPSVLPTENDLLTDNSTTELSPEMLEILENITVNNDEDVIETIPVEKEEQENDAITEERPQREENGPSKDEILAIQMMEEELRELNSGIQENSVSYSMVEEQPVALFSMSRPNAALADSESVEETDVDDEVIAEEETEVSETTESTITTESVTEDTSSDDESITEETSIESEESDNQEGSNVTTVDENSIENTEVLNSVETDSSVSSGNELGSEAETTDEVDNTTLEDVVGVENDVLEEELIEESVQLFSNTYTGINGTIRLPEGVSASAGDMIRVYVYDAPIVVDGKVIKDGGSNSILNKTITLSAGQTSGNFTIDNLPDGDYEISVRYLTGNKYVSGAMLYFCDHGLNENEYLTKVINITDGYTNEYIDVTFPLAETYISGTIDLSNCIPETDTYIAVSTYNESYVNDTRQYAYVLAEAGTQYVDFEFGSKPSSYYLYLSSNLFNSGYYTNNSLTENHSNRTIITVDDAISGIDILIPEEKEIDDSSYDVTINFSNTLDREREYYLKICDANGDSISGKWITVSKGESSLTTSFTPGNLGGVAYLAYFDVTGFDSVYVSAKKTEYYYSEELGITNNILYATNIVGQTEIVVDEPASVEVKGNIDATGTLDTIYEFVYVVAEFDDAIYYTRVSVDDEVYSISVPNYYVGDEFKIFVARGDSGDIVDSTRIYNSETYILSEDLIDITVSAGNYRRVNGTVSLPVVAPENGAVISLSYDFDDDAVELGKYVIYPYENSVDYSVSVLEDVEDVVIDASISTYEDINISRYASSTDDGEILFSETYSIFGTVSLPEDVTLSKDLTVRVYASCSSGSGSTYRTILAGRNSTNYELAVPQDTTLRYLEVYIETENSGLFENVYYVADGESSTDYTRIEIPINSNYEADIQLIDADLIEGSIRLPEYAEYNGAEIEYMVYCQGVNTGDSYSSNYRYSTYTPFEDNYFCIPVPKNSGEDYYVYVSVDENGGNKIHNSDYYYVSDDVMTLDYEDATAVSVGGNYKLMFPLGEYIEGTISFEDGCYIEDSINITLYVRDVETRDTHYIYLRDIYTTNDYTYRVVAPVANDGVTVSAYVYADGDTNIAVETRFYYSAKGTTPNSSDATIVDITNGASGIDITIPKGQTISGKLILPDDYKSLNDLQEVEIYMDSDSDGSYWLYATVDENMNYEAPIPAEASGEYTLRMSFYDSFNSNIVRKNYYYDDENGNALSIDVDGTTSINNIDFELETGYAVSGIVSLPEDIQISNAEINVEVSDGNGNGCTISDLSIDTPSKPYMFAVPKNDDAEITLSYIPSNSRVSSGLDYSSNVYIGTQYYVENSSLSINSDEATALTLTEDMEDVDVTLLTGVVVNVTLVRPEVEKEYISGYVYIQDKDCVIDLSQRFTIQTNQNESKVTLTVPNSYIGEEIYLSYYTYSGNYLYNGTVYVNPDGTYCRTLEKAQTHTVANTNEHRITLAKIEDVQEVVRFKVNFEDGSFTNDELYCQAYAYNVNTGRNYHTYCYFDEIQELEVMIPVNEEDGDYRISAYISNYSDASTNVSEDKRYYYSTSGTTSSESEATTIKSTDTNISITIPKLEVITVNVGFEEGCFLTDDLYCNVQAYDINNYRSYYKSFYFDEIKDYEVVIPVQDKDSQYRVYVYINDYSDEPTNVSTGEYYYYSIDGTTTEEYYATPVYVTDENISITIPKLRSVSGTIIVDDDYQCLDELTEVSAYLSRTSGSGRSYYYTTARVDEEMNYQFFIPEDIVGDYKIGLEFESDFRNNIIKNEYFYYTNSDGSTQSVTIAEKSDITDIDIKAQTGYAVTGTIKLPDDFIAGGDYDSVRYYISLYNGMYVTLSEEEPEAEFMFAVPKSGGTYRLSANANNYFGNLYTGEVYYKTSTDVAYDYSDATSIPVNSNLSGLILTIPTGIKFDVNVELPETYYNSLEMCFRVKSDDGEFENSNTIYAYNGDDNYCGFVLPKHMLGDNVYLTYEIDDYYNELSDTFYTALVYVNPDGTYAGAKKLAKLIQLGETNEFVVTPVSNEAVLMPEYVLESEHPYANEVEETYTYTHPETVDFLAIKFSEETDINDDYLYLYDENDNLLDTYNYEDLSNRTINVPGSSFKLKLTSDYSGTGFGFAIESVTGSNFVLESNHPYESNMDTYYYYTYPESVEELDITFSDNTEFDDYNDYLYIYEGDSDYYYNSYSSDSLKGRTIRIYGNSFKLRLVSDSSDERYGFSITSINPVVYYTVTFKNYDGTVLATQKVEAGDDAYYYGSNPQKAMDENYMYVFNGENINVATGGSVTIAGKGNYAGEIVYDFAIQKAPLTISTINKTVIYGDVIELPINYSGFVNSETETVLLTQPIVSGYGNNPSVGEYDLIISGATADNYEITYDNTSKLSVDKKTVSISSLAVFDKLHDGTDVATINVTSAVFTGVINDDVLLLDVSQATATFSSSEVGNDILVNIAGLAIKGESSSNYVLNNDTYQTTANITSSISASQIAQQITSLTIDRNASVVEFPELPSGYTVSIKTSSDTSVIDLQGNVYDFDESKIVDIVLTISNDDGTDIADTAVITVTVPASVKLTVTVVASENGTATGSGDFFKYENVTVSAVPNSGYEFEGWYIGTEKVSGDISYTFTLTEATTLVAKFKEPQRRGGGSGIRTSYTVKVHFDDEIISYKAYRNDTVKSIKTPQKDGFVFEGWFSDSELTKPITLDTKITSSISLYPKMTPINVPDEWENPFVDINENDWYFESVKFVVEQGLFKGISENQFGPDMHVTRGMLVTVLYRAEGEPELELNNGFVDVEDNAYYAKAISWAKSNNIINGYDSKTFGPNDSVTREQIATIIARYSKLQGLGSEDQGGTTFADSNSISEWAVDSVRYCKQIGLILGDDNNKFNPQNSTTRAETATILYRYVQMIK